MCNKFTIKRVFSLFFNFLNFLHQPGTKFLFSLAFYIVTKLLIILCDKITQVSNRISNIISLQSTFKHINALMLDICKF